MLVVNTFQVGCDPEFLLLDQNNQTIPAVHHFQFAGEVGYDHGGRVAEFRPKPCKGTYTLLKHIQALIKNAPVKDVQAKLRAGALCNQQVLGGHMHFGIPTYEQGPDQADGVLSKEVKKIIKALDALTRTLEHLDILPKAESKARHEHGTFGKFGDVRDSSGHMEYRSMASWIYDPKVAYIIMTAAKLAAADPIGAYEALKDCTSFARFGKWIDSYKSKDLNALRASEKLIEAGLKPLQVDPTVNFRERWERLGV